MEAPEEADRLFESGLGHFRHRQDTLALEAFTMALELFPDHAKARAYRALTRYRTSDSAGVLNDILGLFLRGIEAKELYVLMAHLMVENSPELWLRKARETASMDIPIDVLDGKPDTESSLAPTAESDDNQSTTDETESTALATESDSLRHLREMRRRIEREVGILDEDEDVDHDKKRTGQRRYGQTEIVDGQVRSVAALRPTTMKLKDVVGLDKAKRLIQNYVILPLEKPKLYSRYKRKRGLLLLLYGPPGCGKTMLVNAVAGEIGAIVLVARLHELNDQYVGNSEKNIHAFFNQAEEIRKKTGKPVIIFIDELDALGGKRDRESQQWVRLMVNQLMMELDGLEKRQGLIVVAATNQPWAVDPALKRSGRFGNIVYVPPPDSEQRKKIFEHYLERKPTEKLDLDELARLTDGYSGADIERLIDHALSKPMQRHDQTGKPDKLKMQDVLEALEDKELGGNTLDDWWTTIQQESERDPRDKTMYRPLLDDLRRYRDRKRSEDQPSSMAV